MKSKMKILSITTILAVAAASLSGCFFRIAPGTEEEYFRKTYGGGNCGVTTTTTTTAKAVDKDTTGNTTTQDNASTQPATTTATPSNDGEIPPEWEAIMNNLTLTVKNVSYAGDMTCVDISVTNNNDVDIYCDPAVAAINDTQVSTDVVNAYISVKAGETFDTTVYVHQKLNAGDVVTYGFYVKDANTYEKLAEGHYTITLTQK